MEGVVLKALHRESGFIYSAATDEVGRYRFLRLPRGSYQVTASLQSFRPSETQRITLEAGQAVRFDLVLGIAGPRQSLIVKGDPAPLDLSSAHIRHHVDKLSLSSLPVNGRSLFAVRSSLFAVGSSESEPGTRNLNPLPRPRPWTLDFGPWTPHPLLPDS